MDTLWQELLKQGPFAVVSGALIYYLGSKLERLIAVIDKRAESTDEKLDNLRNDVGILLDRKGRAA